MAYTVKLASAILLAIAFIFSARTVQETGSMTESKNSQWWLNSGAYFDIVDGVGRTNHGDLPPDDKWRILYSSTNPLDTDGGLHPQNIFRLISRSMHEDYSQQAYFKIDTYRISGSPNRDRHNGFLLMSRYKDSQNLYYAGLRVDGNAVIKKKLKGKYHTLALVNVIPGIYSRDSQPNLIPENEWIGLKTVISDNPDGSVDIKLYTDFNAGWELAAEAVDTGWDYGGQVISGRGYSGIRTDFMDASFRDYLASEGVEVD